MSDYSINVDVNVFSEMKILIDKLNNDVNRFSNNLLLQLKNASKDFTSPNYQRAAYEINKTMSKMNSTCENIKKLKDFLDELSIRISKYNYDGRFQ